MRPHAVLPLVATVVSWEFALALFRRWRRSRRPYLRSWAISLFFFAAGTACLWYGTAFGWSEPVFRGYYICGALLSVPWLAMGEIELLARPKVARVILAFLVLFSLDAAITLAASPFVEGAPPISGFTPPHGPEHFNVLSRVLVVVSNAVGTFVVIGGTLWSGWRARGQGPAARSRFRGTLVIALGVAIAAAGGALTFLSEEDSQAATLALGVTVMYGGFVLASRRPGSHRAHRAERRRGEEDTFAPGETPSDLAAV